MSKSSMISYSKSKKSTKVIEPTTTSEMKIPEQKQIISEMKDDFHGLKPMKDGGQIVNIWNSNLEEAMGKIEDIIDNYPYIALVKYLLL